MKTRIPGLGLMTLVATTTLFCALPAIAQTRTRKPTVCANYTTMAARGARLLVCLDGRAPAVWAGGWTEVTFDGAKFAVGFRSAK